MTDVIRLDGVAKRYRGVNALQSVTCSIQAGQVVGLLGHNGAGKTTTMKLILGLTDPTAGSVRVFGEAPRGRGTCERRRRIGYLPENTQFYDNLTGAEVMDYLGRLKGVTRGHRRALLQRVGLADVAQRRVKTYSKGMRQRLGLAQALLGEPRLLLMDEPTVGLDPVATAMVYEILDELRRSGTTILLSSHILPGIERHVDRVIILAQGRLLAQGSLEELRRAADLPVVIETDWEGGPDTATVDELRRRGAVVAGANNGQLRLEVDPRGKLAALRPLLKQEALGDVRINAPSLEALYTYYNDAAARRDTQQDPPCAQS